METNFQDLLMRTIIILPFGVGTIVFFFLGIKRFSRFFMMDYQGNSKGRFKDNLVGNVFMGLGIGCLMAAIFAFQEGALSWNLLPVSLCFGGFIIPIGILGAYWRSYMSQKLWGGFMPIAREKYGYGPTEAAKQKKIDLSKLKLPRRTTITALLIALIVFFTLHFLLYTWGWNGNEMSGIIFRLFVSGLTAFGIFMTIVSAALSRRIQKIRDGESLENDSDS